MQIRPIRTEADHDSAVARITELIAARPDTPEGDVLVGHSRKKRHRSLYSGRFERASVNAKRGTAAR